jgi:LysR family transcriptional regulator, transcriptional activator of the cysJI operon
VAYDNFKLFRDVAQTRSLSRAASMNGVSQSAATQQVQDLEKSLGTALLDRSTRPLVVTQAGQLYADYCRDVLRRRDEFMTELARVKEEAEGTVRVASIYSVGLTEIARLEEEFTVRYPDAHLEMQYLRPERVYAAVIADEADLGLVSYPEATREVKVIPWRQEEMVVAASPYHPLAGRGPIEPAELNGLEFIGFDEDLPIQRDVNRYLREHGVGVNQILHFDNLQMIKEAVAHRKGVSIMPARIMLDELTQGRLVAIPLATGELYRPLGIIHRRKKRFHRVAQGFVELLCEAPETGGQGPGARDQGKDASGAESPVSSVT